MYPAQVVPGGSKAVTFSGSPGAKLRQLENNAANVTFDGIEVDAAFAQTAGFQNHDAANVTFRDGRIGNVTDEKGALVSGANFTFDNVVFHDVRVTDPSVHNECVYAIGVPGMTVRNSLFYSCATMDLFFTYGSWWIPLPPAYGNVTLENNDFGHTYKDDGTWHYYSLYVGNTAADGGTLSGWKVRNNTFEIDAYVEPHGEQRIPLGRQSRRLELRAGRHLPAQRRATSAPTATRPWCRQPRPRRASLRSAGSTRAAQDFRLRAGSPAIDAADPGDYPATDRDGFVRDARPDAGAHEFGAGPPGGGGGGGGAGEGGTPTGRSPAKKRPRIRAARLKPRVICRTAPGLLPDGRTPHPRAVGEGPCDHPDRAGPPRSQAARRALPPAQRDGQADHAHPGTPPGARALSRDSWWPPAAAGLRSAVKSLALRVR